MRLNVNVSFDVKKRTLTKPYIEFLFFKINFFVFCTKNGPITIESHMHKVTKMERALMICRQSYVKMATVKRQS